MEDQCISCGDFLTVQDIKEQQTKCNFCRQLDEIENEDA